LVAVDVAIAASKVALVVVTVVSDVVKEVLEVVVVGAATETGAEATEKSCAPILVLIAVVESKVVAGAGELTVPKADTLTVVLDVVESLFERVCAQTAVLIPSMVKINTAFIIRSSCLCFST
jgi:hypothetical protein